MKPAELADALELIGAIAQHADRRGGVALVALRTTDVPTSDDGSGIHIVEDNPIPEDLEPHLSPHDFREMPRAEIERTFDQLEKDAQELLEHGDGDDAEDAESLDVLRLHLAFAAKHVRRDA